MNCINPKCKSKIRVQTLRTFNQGTMTRRQKRCPKCHTTYYTLEMTEISYEELKRSLSNAENTATIATDDADYRIQEIQDHIKALFDIAKDTKKLKKR